MNNDLKSKLNELFPRGGVKSAKPEQIDFAKLVIASQNMWADMLMAFPGFNFTGSSLFPTAAYSYVFNVDASSKDFMKKIEKSLMKSELANRPKENQVSVSFLSVEDGYEQAKNRFSDVGFEAYLRANPKDIPDNKSKVELAIGRSVDSKTIGKMHNEIFSDAWYYKDEETGDYSSMFERSLKTKKYGFEAMHYLALGMDPKTKETSAAGFATIVTNGEIAYLTHIGTSPNFQKMGVAAEIIAHIAKDMKGLGVDKIYIETKPLIDSKPSFVKKFYESIGFVQAFDNLSTIIDLTNSKEGKTK